MCYLETCKEHFCKFGCDLYKTTIVFPSFCVNYYLGCCKNGEIIILFYCKTFKQILNSDKHIGEDTGLKQPAKWQPYILTITPFSIDVLTNDISIDDNMTYQSMTK